MPFEIELKAHLDDATPVKERLSTVGSYLRSYKKSDTYWYPVQTGLFSLDDEKMHGLPSGVRVRRENCINADGSTGESVLVTYKIKEISDNIEINDEREFTVSSPTKEDASSKEDTADLFEGLLTRLGLYKAICKEKEGWAWAINSETEGTVTILAELSMVKNLGWFLELEIMTSSDDAKTVAKNRKHLLAMLKKLEIPAEQIESRPYTTMLREIGEVQ
jgi:predicted adenylyl cyclase CyaB